MVIVNLTFIHLHKDRDHLIISHCLVLALKKNSLVTPPLGYEHGYKNSNRQGTVGAEHVFAVQNLDHTNPSARGLLVCKSRSLRTEPERPCTSCSRCSCRELRALPRWQAFGRALRVLLMAILPAKIYLRQYS